MSNKNNDSLDDLSDKMFECDDEDDLEGGFTNYNQSPSKLTRKKNANHSKVVPEIQISQLDEKQQD